MDSMEQIGNKTAYYNDELPAIPGVVAELLDLTDDPDVDLHRVQRVLEQDPALCLASLRLSNSSYFGMRHQVSDIRLALVILGIREVRTIALGVSMYSSLNSGGEDAALVRQLWSNSLRMGGLSKRLAAMHDPQKQESAEPLIAGMLTNVGKSFFLARLPEHYARLLKKSGRTLTELMEEEDQLFGCNHLEIAASLLLRWHLPPQLADAVWRHCPHPERPLSQSVKPELTAAVRLARYLLNADNDEYPSAADKDEELWQCLRKQAALGAQSQVRGQLLRLVKEIKAMPILKF